MDIKINDQRNMRVIDIPDVTWFTGTIAGYTGFIIFCKAASAMIGFHGDGKLGWCLFDHELMRKLVVENYRPVDIKSISFEVAR